MNTAPLLVFSLAISAILAARGATAQVLCPDGTYVSGSPQSAICVLAPDGTYVATSTELGSQDFKGRNRNVSTASGGTTRGLLDGLDSIRARRLAEEKLRLAQGENQRAQDRHDLDMKASRFELERERRDTVRISGNNKVTRQSSAPTFPSGTVGWFKWLRDDGESQAVETFMSGMREGYLTGLSAAGAEVSDSLLACLRELSGSNLAQMLGNVPSGFIETSNGTRFQPDASSASLWFFTVAETTCPLSGF